VPKDLPGRDRWKNFKAIGAVVCISQRNGKEHTEIRYYILSRYLSGEKFGTSVRVHWGVATYNKRKGNLHWQLDVTFQEDQCRIRKGHAAANFSLLRRTALSQWKTDMLKNEKAAKVGIKNKRLTAGWDEEYLSQVLFTK